MRYTARTFETARTNISDREREKISRYKTKDVSALLRQNINSDNSYWRILTQATYILFHHPNPISRHESAFVLGELKYRCGVDQVTSISNLRLVVRRDSSMVVKHEAAEALGEIHCIASIGAAADLAKIIAFHKYHEDVVATAKGSLDMIIDYLKKKGYNSTVNELREWSRERK